jgi:RNA polymerase sigma-70 factor (ECF subfamily)
VDDDELMQRLAAGDRAALGTLVERHLEWAWGLACRLTLQHADARDLVQETWARLLERAASYEPRGKLRAYLKTMMRRLWIDRVRRARPELLGEAVDEAPAPPEPRADVAETRGLEGKLWAGVAALPDSQRLALTLRVQGGASYDEIAEVLGTTRKGVEMLLRRARGALLHHVEGG